MHHLLLHLLGCSPFNTALPSLPACRYVGVMHQEFLQYLNSMGVAVTPNVTTGNGMDFLIGRVSYTFGLTGPCIRCGGCQPGSNHTLQFGSADIHTLAGHIPHTVTAWTPAWLHNLWLCRGICS